MKNLFRLCASACFAQRQPPARALVVVALALAWMAGTARAADTDWFPSARARAEHEAGLMRFEDAKFGMFIHWGLYSVPAGEWNGKKSYGEWFQLETRMAATNYAKFADQFKPAQFDAHDWVRLARDAGMKYMVITAKHHDGYCMYNTKQTAYNVVADSAWHHDPMKDLVSACRYYGVQFCFYYSLPDWHSPDFPARYSQSKFHGEPNKDADLDRYMGYMKAQVRELLTGYGPIGGLWFDDGGSFEKIGAYQRAELTHAQEIIDEVHLLQPRCVVNDRLGVGADYTTPEQWVPGSAESKPFEVCLPLNHHWGYNKADKDWKSPKMIIRMLADIAGKGGNFLLDVGPMAGGTMPPEAVKILEQVGVWMKVNGDSIYGTTASPLVMLPFDGRCTQKPGMLYLHVFSWPDNGRLTVPVTNVVKRAWLMADPRRLLPLTPLARGTVLSIPAEMPDPVDSVVAVEIEGKPSAAFPANLAYHKPVKVSSGWPGRQDELNPAHVTDGQLNTLWAAEEKARSGWVEVDLQSEQTVSHVLLSDAPYGRTRNFDVQAMVNGDWKMLATGTTIGDQLWLSFPIKAQVFRLNIRKAVDTPTLAEFQLFGE